MGAIFFMLQFYTIQLTYIGFGDWRHHGLPCMGRNHDSEESLFAELRKMEVPALRERAVSSGVTAAELEQADRSHGPKQAMILLIGEKESAEAASAASPYLLGKIRRYYCSGKWQHHAFIIVCCEATFLMCEVWVWHLHPDEIVTVTLAHMAALVATMWPLVVLAFYLIRAYDSDAQDAQEGHGEEWS